ncbi:hypothetical protein DRN69_01680, partial [Candidatus Pacearchaeota archaeon]
TYKVGIIAQELQKIAPYMITKHRAKLHPDDKNETELLDYQGHALPFILVNAIQEQQSIIQELKQENKAIKQSLCNLGETQWCQNK